MVKLRLPGMDGTYSLGLLFLLYGVAHFSPPETLVAVCAGAVAGSLLSTKKRSSAVQVQFNAANLMISPRIVREKFTAAATPSRRKAFWTSSCVLSALAASHRSATCARAARGHSGRAPVPGTAPSDVVAVNLNLKAARLRH